MSFCCHCGGSLDASKAMMMRSGAPASKEAQPVKVQPVQPIQVQPVQPVQVQPVQPIQVQPVQPMQVQPMPPAQTMRTVQMPSVPPTPPVPPNMGGPSNFNPNPNADDPKKKFPGWLIAVIILAVVLVGAVVGVIVYLVTDDKKNDRPVDTEQHTTVENGDEVASGTEDTAPEGDAEPEAYEENDTLTELPDEAIRDPQVQLKGDGSDTVTIMIYMNGSNLESDYGEATTDLSEMVAAGDSDQVNIIVETLGTKSWKDYNISSRTAQIHKLDGSGLTLLEDNLGQLDATDENNLADFIRYSASHYPADRYILLFWNHGGGPVYGFGYDEYNEDGIMSVDEIKTALGKANVYFDFIGMDCCIMSCMETCLAIYDYCDYAILSEDFESGLGWYYTDWLEQLYQNPSIPTTKLGPIICDDMVKANERDQEEGDDSIMSLIDIGKMKLLYKSWMDFAYAYEDELLEYNFSVELSSKGKGEGKPYLSDYYVTDIMAVASTIDGDEAKALAAAVSSTILYCQTCGDDDRFTGIAVTLPYGDDEFYEETAGVFSNIGVDAEYIAWLELFTEAEGSGDYYDWDDWDEFWDGWDEYDDDYDWGDWDYEDYDWDDFDWDDWDEYIGEWIDEIDWDEFWGDWDECEEWDDFDWDEYWDYEYDEYDEYDYED